MHRRLKAGVREQHRRVAPSAMSEAEALPIETVFASSAPTKTSSTNSFASRLAKLSSKGITISSSTPRAAMSSALTASSVSSFGAPRLGATTAAGCGSNVRTLSEPSITLRWPRWTPSKVPIARRRSLGRASASVMSFTLEAYWARSPRGRSPTSSSTRSMLSGCGRGQGVPLIGAASASLTSKQPIAVRRSCSQYASCRSPISERTYVPEEHSIRNAALSRSRQSCSKR